MVVAALAPPTALTNLPALRRSAEPPPPLAPRAARVKSDLADPSDPPAVGDGNLGSGLMNGSAVGARGSGLEDGFAGPLGIDGLELGCEAGILGAAVGGPTGGGLLTQVGTKPRREPLLLPEVPIYFFFAPPFCNLAILARGEFSACAAH